MKKIWFVHNKCRWLWLSATVIRIWMDYLLRQKHVNKILTTDGMPMWVANVMTSIESISLLHTRLMWHTRTWLQFKTQSLKLIIQYMFSGLKHVTMLNIFEHATNTSWGLSLPLLVVKNVVVGCWSGDFDAYQPSQKYNSEVRNLLTKKFFHLLEAKQVLRLTLTGLNVTGGSMSYSMNYQWVGCCFCNWRG